MPEIGEYNVETTVEKANIGSEYYGAEINCGGHVTSNENVLNYETREIATSLETQPLHCVVHKMSNEKAYITLEHGLAGYIENYAELITTSTVTLNS